MCRFANVVFYMKKTKIFKFAIMKTNGYIYTIFDIKPQKKYLWKEHWSF